MLGLTSWGEVVPNMLVEGLNSTTSSLARNNETVEFRFMNFKFETFLFI